MYSPWMNEILRCPENLEKLYFAGHHYRRIDGISYPVKSGILSAVFPNELIGDDAKFNKFYNFFAPLYDLNEKVIGKLLLGIDMINGRKEIVSHLGLKPGMNVLEVSPGPGVFQKYLRKSIGDNGKLVALDLSIGMLRQCQKRNKALDIELVHGNAQYLPFADNSFDAMFHFGGVNLFNDPQKAIDEFVRVVKKDGLVCWGDEGFSQNFSNQRKKKILSKMNPGFVKSRPDIPETVYDAKEYEVYNGMAYLVVAKKR